MKNKNKLWLYPLIVMGFVLILTNSCKKKDDNNNNTTPINNNEIIFNPNLTYGTETDIDGNVYKTITIGTQTWMAENLKVTKYNDDTSIPLVTDNTAWTKLTTPGYCWSNNDEATYKNTYGALYNWHAVNTGKLCPTGWHVPADSEWTTLTTYLGGDTIAGGKLKEIGITHWRSPNTGATNSSGFTALPGGYRYNYDGSFGGMGGTGGFWSATESGSDAWNRHLNYDNANVSRSDNSKTNALPVRCLKDN